MLSPIVILLVGIVSVVGLIVLLRLNPFLALLISAIVVSLLSPGELAGKITRVAEAFGLAAGKVGIVIALAAVVGKALIESGAADRIVRAFLSLLGERRAGAALMGSGFLLSVPVFVDTVFFLLIPLARSLRKQTGKNYLLYLLAIACGAMLTHTLVPPTPGPLVMADALGIDLGTMIVVGLAVCAPSAVAGLFLCRVFNRWFDLPLRPVAGEETVESEEEPPQEKLPGLWASVLPIGLPVVLISANTILRSIAPDSSAASVTAVLGNPNLALLFSAAIAMTVLARTRGLSLRRLGQVSETALANGGIIILITAAGGAFGAMLREAGLKELIEPWIRSDLSGGVGFTLLTAGFLVAALMKTAQGSTTVSLITTSALFAGMGVTPEWLGCHPVYLATSIGAGSMVGSWMNDSAFWIFSRMGGLTEIETVRSWTVVLALVGVVGFLVTLVYAWALPMA